jgi:acyl carrier protein
MYVFRKARELAAHRLGLSLEKVGSQTSVSPHGQDLVEELYQPLAQELWRDQGAGLAESEAEPPPWADLGLKQTTPATVAEVAGAAVRAVVRLLVSQRLDVPPADLAGDVHFTVDLGADSLTRVDLVLLLEEWLDVSVPDDSMALIQTVGDAELFAVLYDHVREGVVLALGEEARQLACDRPLAQQGAEAHEAALRAASAAVGAIVRYPEGEAPSLRDVVRVAFLLQKLRLAVAAEAGVAAQSVTADTVPEQDLGLGADRAQRVFDTFARSLDLGQPAPADGHRQPLQRTWRQLAAASGAAR